MTPLDLATPYGPARAHLHPAADPVGALVLGHGAGGGVAAPDLVAVAAVAVGARVSVALVEQPYRVAGRRSPAPAHQLDTAWTAVVEALRAGPLADLALVTGGRSSGARVACRTAEATSAAGVLCLAFPLHPPARKPGAERKTRQPELDAVAAPLLVVQGERDPFGRPEPGGRRRVAVVAGDHGLKADVGAVAAAVLAWLPEVLG